MSEATLASVVSELRASLGDDAKEPRFVRTVHGHGYAFCGQASGEGLEAPPAPPTRRLPGAVLALVAVASLLAASAVFLKPRSAGHAVDTGVPPRSLAVLPLEDAAADPERSYVVDGLTEALVTRLAESGLAVVSRTSALRYRGSTRPRAEIAQELGADWLVEGSTRREGDRIRLVVRLIAPPAERAVWTRSYESPVEETSQLPARAARDIAEASRLALTPERRARLASARPVDPEAYDACLRGRYQMNRGSLDSNRKAIELFQEALGRDPEYPPAYAYLANAYLTLATVWAGEPPRAMRGLAEAAAGKALELDPDLADAHTYLANIKLFEWDFTGAEREFQRAIELDPSAGNAHSGYASYLTVRGRFDEAVAEARKGEALDPLSVRARRNVGYVLFQARRYDEAIASLQTVAGSEPRDTFSRWFLGWALSSAGRHQEAIAELERAVELSDRAPGIVGALATTMAQAGREKDARVLLAELADTSRRRYVTPAAFIMPHAALGERDLALEWLERGAEQRINFMVYMDTLEILDPLRDDPRFRELVKRIGLPERPR